MASKHFKVENEYGRHGLAKCTFQNLPAGKLFWVNKFLAFWQLFFQTKSSLSCGCDSPLKYLFARLCCSKAVVPKHFLLQSKIFKNLMLWPITVFQHQYFIHVTIWFCRRLRPSWPKLQYVWPNFRSRLRVWKPHYSKVWTITVVENLRKRLCLCSKIDCIYLQWIFPADSSRPMIECINMAAQLWIKPLSGVFSWEIPNPIVSS